MTSPANTPKRDQIIKTIRSYGGGIEWRGDWINRVALECECAKSTVYRAIAYLKAIGAMNTDNFYIGRVPELEEIQALVAADGGNTVPVLLTDDRVAVWCEHLICEPDMFWVLMRGWLHRCFEWVNGGSYGLMLMNKGGAA